MNIYARFGSSKSRNKNFKTRYITYKIYIKPLVNSSVAPPCVNNSCQKIFSSETHQGISISQPCYIGRSEWNVSVLCCEYECECECDCFVQNTFLAVVFSCRPLIP